MFAINHGRSFHKTALRKSVAQILLNLTKAVSHERRKEIDGILKKRSQKITTMYDERTLPLPEAKKSPYISIAFNRAISPFGNGNPSTNARSFSFVTFSPRVSFLSFSYAPATPCLRRTV